MLKVTNLCKKLGDRDIINDISFSLNSRGITALLGPNGAGKTTLMRLLTGYYEADKGTISIFGHDIASQRRAAVADLSYVPENGGIYQEMTILEYLKFMSDIKHISSANFFQRLPRILSKLELTEVLHQKCENLSKGFSRRVAIAGALITQPKFLILDEPCEGLDVRQKINLRAFLKECSRTCAILISTHIMEDVEALAERILLLTEGRLICDATPHELKNKAHQFSIEDSFFTLTQR